MTAPAGPAIPGYARSRDGRIRQVLAAGAPLNLNFLAEVE